MRRIFAASIAATMALPLAAIAQPNPPEPAQHQPMPKAGDVKPMIEAHRLAHSPMEIAKHLNAMETAIGIRTDQLDAWRKYTSSYMDMTRMEMPSPADNSKRIFGEAMADMAIQRGEKAKEFKNAAEELRKVLDAKQLSLLEGFHHELRGPNHPRAEAPAPAHHQKK